MNWNRGASALAIAVFCTVWIGCKAGPAEDSGFLAQSDKLSEQRDLYPFHGVWIDPVWFEPKWKTLVVKPVNTDYIKKQGWWAKANLKGDEKKMAEGLQNIANYAQNEFQKKFREDKKKRLEVVDSPRNDSLILEMALVELVPNKASLGALGLAATVIAAPLGASVAAKETAKGAVAIEGRWRRADNGQVVAMFADREGGKFGPWNLRRATWYKHAEKILQEWAQQWVRIANAPPGTKIKDTARMTLKPW